MTPPPPPSLPPGWFKTRNDPKYTIAGPTPPQYQIIMWSLFPEIVSLCGEKDNWYFCVNCHCHQLDELKFYFFKYRFFTVKPSSLLKVVFHKSYISSLYPLHQRWGGGYTGVAPCPSVGMRSRSAFCPHFIATQTRLVQVTHQTSWYPSSNSWSEFCIWF